MKNTANCHEGSGIVHVVENSVVAYAESPTLFAANEFLGARWSWIILERANAAIDPLKSVTRGRALRQCCEVSSRRRGDFDPVRPGRHAIVPALASVGRRELGDWDRLALL